MSGRFISPSNASCKTIKNLFVLNFWKVNVLSFLLSFLWIKSSPMISCSIVLILSYSSLASVFKRFFWNKPFNDFDCCVRFRDVKYLLFSLIFNLFLFVSLLEACPGGEYVYLAWLWLKGNISLSVKYSYLSVLPLDNIVYSTSSLLFLAFHL